MKSEGYTERVFNFDEVRGKVDVDFVFLPVAAILISDGSDLNNHQRQANGYYPLLIISVLI